MFGIFSQIQGWVKIKGGSDGTKIGNVTDSLKTNVTASALPTGAATESTLTAVSGKLNPLTTDPAISASGLVVRTIPYRPPTFGICAVTIPPALNKSMLALFNPGASTVILKIQYLKIINNQTTAVTGAALDFRMRRITGLTGGTTIVPQPFDTNDTLGAGILCSQTGTVSGESTTDLLRYVWSSDEWGPGTADVEAGDHAQQQTGYAFQNPPEGKTITLRSGQGITIKCLTNSSQGNFDFEMCFSQEVP
jgi:hypothetical protein